MKKNLFFVSHNHKESGGADDTASKHNTYEVSSPLILLTWKLTWVMIEGGNDPQLGLVLAQVGFQICTGSIINVIVFPSRQGCYTEEGDIVVLCAYLGQLARLRDAFAGEVITVIDEHDQAALADQEAEVENDMEGAGIEQIRVTKRVMHDQYTILVVLTLPQVRLRTVDNYQGEEGKVMCYPMCM